MNLFWILFFSTAIIAAIWLWSGFYKLNIGWKGLVLFLGRRTHIVKKEGWQFVPWPWSIQAVDCHEKTIELDPLEDVVTNDNIEVKIYGSIVRDITDLYAYLSVDQNTIKDGMDDIWDEQIRSVVGKTDLDKVLRMKGELAENARAGMHKHTLNWGITIIRVNISEVEPDQGTTEDLERKEREILKREGQKIQAEWSGQLEKYFSGTEPLTPGGALGPKLSPDMAHEMTLYTLELAEKKRVESKTFGLDVTTSTAITTALKAIMGGRS
jgi:regulator of protease activity HflC (stomatin/prohibitin superfamily)